MPAASGRKGTIGLSALGLPLALLMPFPRINVSFPKKRKEAQGPEAGGEDNKLVDWSDRNITLFHDHRLFPRISIVFPSEEKEVEEAGDISVLSDEMLIKEMMLEEQDEGMPENVEPVADVPLPVPEEGPVVEAESEDMHEEEQDVEPLEVARRIVNGAGARDIVLPGGVEIPEERQEHIEGCSDTISQGSMVLVEGSKGAMTRAVTENLCYGLLENGHTVTYVTTSLSVQDFIVEMHNHNYRIAQYLPDRKVLVIPVYPIIEERGNTDGLLDKLMSSSQLRTTDVIIVDSLSDFLGGRFDEIICMRLLEYLRNLSNLGKTVILVVANGQKGILSLRLASDLHFALPVEEGKGVQVKRYHPLRDGSPGMLSFRIDPAQGLISQPHRTEKK